MKSVLRIWVALTNVVILCACGEMRPEENISEEESLYEPGEYPYDGNIRLEKSESALLEYDETMKPLPFRKHREIDFRMHWMHFDRPIMLFIDDPPGLNDSLFIY